MFPWLLSLGFENGGGRRLVLAKTLLKSLTKPRNWATIIFCCLICRSNEVKSFYIFKNSFLKKEREHTRRDDGQREKEERISSRLHTQLGALRRAQSHDPEIATQHSQPTERPRCPSNEIFQNEYKNYFCLECQLKEIIKYVNRKISSVG